MPEVTLPVVPGMEGCHWPFRKVTSDRWPQVMNLLLTGRPVKGEKAVGWLVDYAGPIDDLLKTAWKVANGKEHGLPLRKVEAGALKGLPRSGDAASPGAQAIQECVVKSCGVSVAEALDIQARHSAAFMTKKACLKGMIGTTFTKTMTV
jgi:enoyl-CoA hydratase/carnithine racemase